MKAGDVLKTLRITRPTLYRYVENGYIKRTLLPNGQYEYDDESVYAFLNKDVKRKTVIYARVSTSKQKKDLENQVQMLETWAFNSGYQVNHIYSDVSSGISFEKRKDFFKMLDEITNYKVENVIISYKDRLSRVGFELFYHLFSKYGTNIIVVSDIGNKKLDDEEVFSEITSLLHCYSMKLYSKTRAKSIEIKKEE
ncbi:Resolvase domain protein [Methanohalobium evestigatum Z-7303]|uniref:Resolvase domain protein n=1 Tax=Methanohalobium evestigatum (strain ATCC BAA-1072 / DSM 3721 / NBRC 107634 / OCM 161 / Z-7303) TaxID=644295 RepID=D7EA86_METEZ|nr:IS607 family transposase [Methanohalobium evestigatum]ADI74757.1 Resolvase domain protein [Methanohalobium evestigatum Z-7303]